MRRDEKSSISPAYSSSCAALMHLRSCTSKLFIGDALAIRRITRYIHSLVRIIEDLDLLLLSVRDGCNPDLSYHFICPQFNGADSGAHQQRRSVPAIVPSGR
jgi:indoleamine 2,3-dioxygenase